MVVRGDVGEGGLALDEGAIPRKWVKKLGWGRSTNKAEVK